MKAMSKLQVPHLVLLFFKFKVYLFFMLGADKDILARFPGKSPDIFRESIDNINIK